MDVFSDDPAAQPDAPQMTAESRGGGVRVRWGNVALALAALGALAFALFMPTGRTPAAPRPLVTSTADAIPTTVVSKPPPKRRASTRARTRRTTPKKHRSRAKASTRVSDARPQPAPPTPVPAAPPAPAAQPGPQPSPNPVDNEFGL